MRGRRLIIALTACLALGVASGASARGDHKVIVLNGDQQIATFKVAKCAKTKGGFHALGRSTDGAWGLHVVIDNFTGFHRYDMTLGANADPYAVISKRGNDSVRYSNLFKPPFPSPGGGAVDFRGKGGVMGVGFQPAWSVDGSDAVVFAGAVDCRYKKKH